MFVDSTILITGGTGTFGNTVLRKFKDTDVREIRVFSRDEKKQDDLRREIQSPKVRFFIGDVREYDSVLSAMRGVDYVVHAAALKQVPSCEFFPLEAIRTNTLGAENVMNAAVACEVKRVVVLSTDKAVYPINAMGMSKALMEKLMVAKARTSKHAKTVLCGTRYGNVIASRGSVIPLFISQILAGESLTITDPHMTRFMMTLDDAMDLVQYAFGQGQHGDMFVQKAPAATIETIAQALLNIFESRNEIRIIGTRHGEKLYETLVTREEMAKAEDVGRYFRIPMDDRNLNYAAFFTEGDSRVSPAQDYNSHNTVRLDVPATTELLLGLPLVKNAVRERRVTV